jgi:Na+/proline symporter
MWSVVGTEVLQFFIMTLSCFVVGYIAYMATSGEAIQNATPAGWDELFFGWRLHLDWSQYLDSVNTKIETDGFELFGLLMGMMIFKGIFASLAGPVPSYDMQRILSTRTPGEAAKMSALTILVLYIPRYLMVAGFGVLGVVYLKPEIAQMGAAIDFEQVLPMVMEKFVPHGWRGLLLAGLLAAFMGTFAAFINAAPAYLVNDLYKKYVNPRASEKTYLRYSYLASIGLVIIGIIFGFLGNSINTLTLWITSALYGGYAAANMLKWIWWRCNGYGYFGGMLAGLIGSTFLPIIFPETPPIYLFPVLLIFSLAGCFSGILLFPPESDEVLIHFYKKTRPWGFWKPIISKIRQTEPSFIENKTLGKDTINVVIGIIWQMSQVVLPMYFMLRHTHGIWASLGLFVLTSYLLKKNWLDRLHEEEKLL